MENVKPKRCINSYMYYTMCSWDNIKQELGCSDARTIVREIGRRWRLMSKELKKPYDAKARKDNLRYKREMETYRRRQN